VKLPKPPLEVVPMVWENWPFPTKTIRTAGFFLSPLGMCPRPWQLGKICVVICQFSKSAWRHESRDFGRHLCLGEKALNRDDLPPLKFLSIFIVDIRISSIKCRISMKMTYYQMQNIATWRNYNCLGWKYVRISFRLTDGSTTRNPGQMSTIKTCIRIWSKVLVSTDWI